MHYTIAVIPGDLWHHTSCLGIVLATPGVFVPGKLKAKIRSNGFQDVDPFRDDFSSNTIGLDQIAKHDAIFLGAVGYPGVPDHVSLWGLLIPIRRMFQQYINLRPVRLFEGVPCPLVGRTAEDIDLMIIRENNEGEYSEIGGRIYQGTLEEMVTQESVFTRRGVDRVLHYAFKLAQNRPAKHFTSATKALRRWWLRLLPSVNFCSPQL